MRTPEEILDTELDKLVQKPSFIDLFYKINRYEILSIIKNIQDEAWNEAIEAAAENVEFYRSNEDERFDGINYDSILKLKK